MRFTTINLIGASPGFALLLARSLELSGLKSLTVNRDASSEFDGAFLGQDGSGRAVPEMTEIKHTLYVRGEAAARAGTALLAVLARENEAEVALRILDRPDGCGDVNVYFISEDPESIRRICGPGSSESTSGNAEAPAAVPGIVIVRDYCASAPARVRLEGALRDIAKGSLGCRVIKLKNRSCDRRAELAAVYNEHFDFRGLSGAYRSMLDRISMTVISGRKEAEKKKW